MESILDSPGHLLITGDFNFHCDDPNDPDHRKFADLLSRLCLRQLVSGATHKSGHTLDLIITRESDTIVSNWIVGPRMMSDHHCIHFGLNVRRPPNTRVDIERRRLSGIDTEVLAKKLEEAFNKSQQGDAQSRLILIPTHWHVPTLMLHPRLWLNLPLSRRRQLLTNRVLDGGRTHSLVSGRMSAGWNNDGESLKCQSTCRFTEPLRTCIIGTLTRPRLPSIAVGLRQRLPNSFSTSLMI
ncbi:hypothetical protein BSL78_09749 [Apostichopus japonicus]|uniref:Endonuclease/exonuclease/phosphatase domain-containing protein n=1 Tax=Stichopus japonicus TaxID=307972 RepID=A0A2G8KZD7_STIJA|nr:hypothetical protein BSL78_09749 [Apostichopus japonicus]